MLTINQLHDRDLRIVAGLQLNGCTGAMVVNKITLQ